MRSSKKRRNHPSHRIEETKEIKTCHIKGIYLNFASKNQEDKKVDKIF